MLQSHRQPLHLFQMRGLQLQCVVLATVGYVQLHQFLVEEWRDDRDEPRDSRLSAKRDLARLRRVR